MNEDPETLFALSFGSFIKSTFSIFMTFKSSKPNQVVSSRLVPFFRANLELRIGVLTALVSL